MVDQRTLNPDLSNLLWNQFFLFWKTQAKFHILCNKLCSCASIILKVCVNSKHLMRKISISFSPLVDFVSVFCRFLVWIVPRRFQWGVNIDVLDVVSSIHSAHPKALRVAACDRCHPSERDEFLGGALPKIAYLAARFPCILHISGEIEVNTRGSQEHNALIVCSYRSSMFEGVLGTGTITRFCDSSGLILWRSSSSCKNVLLLQNPSFIPIY